MSSNSPIIITSKKQKELKQWMIYALKELNNYATMDQISDKLEEYIALNLIHINFSRWQYHIGWTKEEIKGLGFLSYKKEGKCCYWSII